MVKKVQANKHIIRRFKIVEGHFKKIHEMVDNNISCIDILNQLTAVKNALSSAQVALLNTHLYSCIIKNTKQKKQLAIDGLLSVFKKINS